MGDNHALEIASIDTIKIKIFDATVHTIKEVRHMKSLKNNLLSLGQMIVLTAKLMWKNEIMKTVKGVFVLIKAEKISANLYMLKGKTLQEIDASVVSNKEESVMM